MYTYVFQSYLILFCHYFKLAQQIDNCMFHFLTMCHCSVLRITLYAVHTWVLEAMGTRRHGYSKAWVLEAMGTRRHGYSKAWVLEGMGTRRHGYLKAWVLEGMGT